MLSQTSTRTPSEASPSDLPSGTVQEGQSTGERQYTSDPVRELCRDTGIFRHCRTSLCQSATDSVSSVGARHRSMGVDRRTDQPRDSGSVNENSTLPDRRRPTGRSGCLHTQSDDCTISDANRLNISLSILVDLYQMRLHRCSQPGPSTAVAEEKGVLLIPVRAVRAGTYQYGLYPAIFCYLISTTDHLQTDHAPSVNLENRTALRTVLYQGFVLAGSVPGPWHSYFWGPPIQISCTGTVRTAGQSVTGLNYSRIGVNEKGTNSGCHIRR